MQHMCAYAYERSNDLANCSQLKHHTLFGQTMFSDSPNAYKFLRKNTYNSLLLRRYRTRKNTGGVKFWQIAVDEANGEEYFGEYDQMTDLQ